jgi:hypothetical protein
MIDGANTTMAINISPRNKFFFLRVVEPAENRVRSLGTDTGLEVAKSSFSK